MGGGVSQEEASVRHQEAEPIECSSQLIPALGESGSRLSGDIRDLAAVG